MVRTVELGKVLVEKELTPVASQKTVKGVFAYITEVQMVGFKHTKLRRAFSKHWSPQIDSLEECNTD